MTATFTHVGLLGHREHPGVEEVVSGLLNLLDDRGLQVTIEDRLATLSHFEKREMESRDQLGAMVDLAIVIGGDGSLLSAARTLVKHDTPVIGVNRGRLGFLTDVSPDELIEQVSAVLDGDFLSEQRFLLDAEVWRGEQVIGRGEALNDIVVNSGASAQMIEFELSIDGEFVYRLNADGLLVATPDRLHRVFHVCGGAHYVSRAGCAGSGADVSTLADQSSDCGQRPERDSY